MNDKSYSVLGLHGEDVLTVNKFEPLRDAEGNPILGADGQPQLQQAEERNVVRVRMFVNDQMIDEDFTLPRLITVEEQIEQAVTARIAEIQTNGTDPKSSQVVPEQTEQIVADIPAGEGGQNV